MGRSADAGLTSLDFWWPRAPGRTLNSSQMRGMLQVLYPCQQITLKLNVLFLAYL